MATGDPVISLTSGYIDLYANGGSTIHGVFMGCRYPDPNNNKQTIWRPVWNAVAGLASTDVVVAYITSDPMAVFEIQSGSAGTPLADLSANSDIVIGTPNTVTGRSGAYLDSTHATTATYPLRIIALGGGYDVSSSTALTNYDPTSGYNIVQVMLNSIDIKSTTGI